MRKQIKSNLSPRVSIRRHVSNPSKRTVVIPRNITVSKLKSDVQAYRSSISNLFTDTDVTLTQRGYLRFFTDTGYSGDVQKALTIAEQDDLINGLIHSLVNLSSTNANFNLPYNNKKEQAVWDTWAKRVNISVRNTLPGLKMLNSQIIISLLQTGMATMDFEWGKLQVGRQVYDMPMKITIIPTLGVRLSFNDLVFGDENVYASINEEYYKMKMNNATDDQSYENLFVDFGKKRYGMQRKNAFAIKFRYTSNNTTLYPIPFLKPSFESIALRHKLLDADISLLESIINKIIQVKVGDEKMPPQPTRYDDNGHVISEGDIDAATTMFQNMTEEVEVIATPYYYKIEYIMPDTTVLLDQKKYIQSTYNILSNFGIMLDPSSSSNSTNFDKLNIVNYENLAISLQEHVSGWYTWLASLIIAKNGNKLKALPTVSFDEPNIDKNDDLQLFKSLFDSGVLDVYTLLDKYGFDRETIEQRLLMQYEAEDNNEKLFQPRATFKQEIVDTSGNKTTTSNSEDTVAKKAGGEESTHD